MNKQKYYNIILIIFTTIIFSILIINQHKAFHKQYPTIIINDIEYRRGAHIKFDQNTEIITDSAKIIAEENTEIILNDTNPGQEDWKLLVGRLSIDGRHQISIHDLLILSETKAEITHYSWKNKLILNPSESSIKLILHDQELIIEEEIIIDTSNLKKLFLESQE